jgi:ABC-type cobalamin/Fe3+-siderophores transport system ATPase subunit
MELVENQFHPNSGRKLLVNLYDIYHCCVYGEKLLMMDRGTVQNM